jgi:hypothetical protein
MWDGMDLRIFLQHAVRPWLTFSKCIHANMFVAFQLPFGKLYSLFNPKWVFMTALGLFEIGSLIAGAAPNSTALIIGVSIFSIFLKSQD